MMGQIHMRFLIALFGVFGVMAHSLLFAQGTVLDKGQVQLNRYTTQLSVPEDNAANPLEVFARITYPRTTVTSIGDALRHTLLRTGYSLADSELSSYEAKFLNLPLPESQRTLGTFKVKDILKVLVGSAWELRQDDVSRQVSLSLTQRYAALVKTVVPTAPALEPLKPAPAFRVPASGAVDASNASSEVLASGTGIGVNGTWRINPNDLWLSAAMTRWAKEARVNLNWAMAEDYPITAQSPRTYSGTFTDSVRSALSEVSRDLVVVLNVSGNELTISKRGK